MKIEILTKDSSWVGEDKIFTHFWNNSEDNYWDTCKSELKEITDSAGVKGTVHVETEWDKILIEEGERKGEQKYSNPMEFYLGENYPNYYWKEIPNVKFKRTNLDAIVIQLSTEEVEDYKIYFFKITDNNTITYYYCTDISTVSDPNNVRTSWELKCELDCWATFWAEMHSLMKQFKGVDIDFAHKMCDRFVFNYTKGLFTEGFWLDYIKQQYLCRTNQYKSELYNFSTNNITLDQWIYLNSNSTDYNDWIKIWKDDWINDKKCVTSYVECKPDNGHQEASTDYDLVTKAENYGKIQNVSLATNEIFMSDDNYNSNNKYRYFIIRLGNNYLPTAGSENKHKTAIENSYITEKVLIDSTPTIEYYRTYINGETLSILPFPKGIEENKYLYYLNSTTSGLTLGNGTVMGMPINDIPPSVLSVALRTYNDKHTESQTIGDKLSFRDIQKTDKSQSYHCPADLSSLKIQTLWPWDPTEIHKLMCDVPEIGIRYYWAYNKDQWVHTEDSGGYTYFVIDSDPGKFKKGEYYGWCTNPSGGWENRFPRFKLNSSESLGTLANETCGSTPRLYTWGLNTQYKFAYYKYLGPDPTLKSSWEFVGSSLFEATLTEENEKYLIIESSVIPPESPKINRWYEKPGTYDYMKEVYNPIYYFEADSEYKIIPTIFTDFSYIPITLVRRVGNNIEGWTEFFEKTYELLTNNTLTKTNTMNSEPLFYSPGLWKWVYYIDGMHKIEVTNDMLDLQKMFEKAPTSESRDWNIKLNIAMSTHTSYLLDLKDVLDKKYPITKTGMEFISEEYTSYPTTTEAYNNWLQTNQSYIETAKNAKDIDWKWRISNNVIGGLLGFGESGLSGMGSGMTSGAVLGAMGVAGAGMGIGGFIGAAAGLAMGGMEILGRSIWLNRSKEEDYEQFYNRINGMKNNLYSSPATMLNPGAFTSGSLVYSPNTKTINKEYELFKTYTIPEIIKDEIWCDISWNGYQFASQCMYEDYNNRINFNVIECDLNSKSYMVINYLKTKMMELNSVFSQNDSIKTFISRCSKEFRVFKCQYDINNMEQIIEGNIELKREWVSPNSTNINFR